MIFDVIITSEYALVSHLWQIQYTAAEMAITRREFLQSSISLALVSLNGHAGATGNIHTGHGELLPDVVYRLFPHSRLPEEVYEQVTEQLDSKIGQSKELTAMMNDALELLAGSTGKNWSEQAEQDQTAALATIQHMPFFQFVLNETLGGIYRHPLTWELLGFEGSSLEFGGYINRGLNDIDWLPE